VQIGNRVIEVSDDGILFIDGHTAFENDEETTSFAGYTLKRSIKGTKGHIVVFDLDLLDGKAIEIRSNTKTRMVFVDVEGHFEGSEGLLGAPMGEDDTGLLSRDGSFDMTGNWNLLERSGRCSILSLCCSERGVHPSIQRVVFTSPPVSRKISAVVSWTMQRQK
jgi:hypothetical protein